jgi:uncharacterized protein
MRRLVTGLAGLVFVAAVLIVPGGERDPGGGKERLSVCTGNTTGVYYILGGGLAQRISRHLPQHRATAEPTGASVENLQRVVRGDCDVAFTLADSAAEAIVAEEPIAALARLYPNYTQVLVRRSVGVQRIGDLRGKRVSTGSPNSGTEVIAQRLLRAAGLDPGRDVRAQALSLPESVQGLKDGVIDALFWSGGLNTPGVRDLLASLEGRVGFVPLDDLAPILRATYGPMYEDAEIPADPANGQRRPTKTIAVPNLLVVNAGMSEALAYSLTRLLFERKDDLGANVHPAARRIPAPPEQSTGPVPLHPGARRYFREAGG